MWTHVETGTPFGHYRLRRVLGEGGMGRVYEAFDGRCDRVVALKVLPAHSAEDPRFRERFRRESRAAAGLNDPHVIPIHQYGEIDGRLYLDMRLVQGVGLDAVIEQYGPMSPKAAVSIVGQVASALTAAHAQGLVHRDVKPSNMLLCADAFVYLIDFGIARTAGQAGLTSAGAAVGTFAYMSPERLAGVADPRSDVYALACVLHECLTGAKPFPGTSLEEQITAHLIGTPPRPSLAGPEIPAAFDEVVARGMAKNPEKRYQTAAELAEAARDALTGAVTPAETAGPAQRPAAEPACPVSNSPSMAETELAHPLSNLPHPQPSEPTARGRGRLSRRHAVLAVAVAVAVAVTSAWFAMRRAQPNDVAFTRSSAPPAIPTAPSFKVTTNPGVIVVDSPTHTAYICNHDAGSISVVNTMSRTVTATIEVGNSTLWALALDRSGHTLYASGLGSIAAIDTVSRTVTATIEVGPAMLPGLALDAARHSLYTTDGLSVMRIDTVTRTVVDSFLVGNYARQLELDPDARTLYAVNGRDASVAVIDTVSHAVAATIRVGRNPKRLALDSAAHTLYVTDYDDGTVSVIDTASRTVTATIEVGRNHVGAMGIALDAAGHTVYVTNSSDATVSLIDTAARTVTATVQVGDNPIDVAVDITTHAAYAVDNLSGSVSEIYR